MKPKLTILTVFMASILVLTPGALAQETVETDPGIVTPDSGLYGLELAVENVGMNVGLLDSTNVAYERASEMNEAQEANNTEGLDRASEALNQAMNRVQQRENQTEQEQENLNKTVKVLNRVKENAPEEAQAGLQTAIENVKQQRGRPVEIPTGTPTQGKP